MNTVTELQKQLYNKHLSVSRKAKGKPFKYKKDFSDLIDTEKHKYLQRISTLFLKHPELDFHLFFEAPYKLYPDVEYFGLDYFSSMRAIKSYTTYKKIRFLQDPDSQIEHVKQSLEFIAKYCIKQNIHFYRYPTHQLSDFYVWMAHYKENKINLYTMFMFPNIFSITKTLNDDIQKFYLGDFISKFQQLHQLYQNSKLLKPYLTQAFDKINNFVYSELTKHQSQVS